MKRPRIGERVRTAAGTEGTIVSEFLHQPAAPRFFRVELAGGVELHVTFRGQGWVEYRADDAPKTNLSARPAQSPSHHEQEPDSQAGGRTGPESSPVRQGVVASCAQVQPRRLPATRLAKADSAGSARHGVPGEPATGHVCPHGTPRGPLAGLHARLDAAREAYRREKIRERVDADALLRLQEVYCGLIAELDRRDPLFYGPVRTDEPIGFGQLQTATSGRFEEDLTEFEASTREVRRAYRRKWRAWRSALRESEAQ